MRRSLVCAALALGLARPAAAQNVLYATAASQQGVDLFRVGSDGLPVPEPVRRTQTGSPKPRRLIARGCNLYVAEKDRIEVFRIHSGGRLELVGATKKAKESQPHDFELSPDGKTLYVPFRRNSTIASYPLDDAGRPSQSPVVQNGVPAGQPTSCVYDSSGVGLEDIEIANGKLYVATINRVEVYAIADDGRLLGAARIPQDLDGDGTIEIDEQDLDDDGDIDQDDRDNWVCPYWSDVPDPDAPLECIDTEVKPRPKRPVNSCPTSKRNHINGGTGLVVAGQSLFVGERFVHQVQGFALLDDGNFPTTPPDATHPMEEPTGKQKKQERRSRKKNKTEETIRYIGLTYYQPANDDPILYGAGYIGRVDGFRLRTNPDAPGTWRLPKDLTSATKKDVTSSPTRTFIANNPSGRPIMYVAAGESDRVRTFKLFAEGGIDDQEEPEDTVVQRGSYPNDVVLVDITTCD